MEAMPTAVPSGGVSPTPAMPVSPQDAFYQMYGANMMGYGGYYPGNMAGMSPEQMMWMQQMYTQQMAQLMQLWVSIIYWPLWDMLATQHFSLFFGEGRGLMQQ